MKNTTILSSFLIGVILASPAIARPVSYPGGWTVMQMNDSDSHSLHVHYSPNAHYSIGYKGEYFQDKNWQFHGAQLNYLVKRWNATNSQANIYAKNAVGLAYSDNSSFDTRMSMAGFTGVAADWETRRWFTSYENHYVNAGNIDSFFNQSARIGIAPYIGDYGDLHTWLMLKVDYTPSQNKPLTFTPLIRLFKSEYLAELGISNKGDALLNWVIRF